VVENAPHIDWLPESFTAPGRLGLTHLPGVDDLPALKAQGVTHIVCLITDRELLVYGVADLVEAYHAAGFTVRRLPIVDMAAPMLEEMRALLLWLTTQLQGGAHVLTHCIGGWGRSGTVAACYLITRGLSAAAAIAEVRRVRSPHAVESAAQEAFVHRFASA
jgi:protein-tyrosine phosphatase